GLRPGLLQMRLRRHERAPDRLSSCPARSRRRDRVDEGHAVDRIRTSPAGGVVRSLSRRVPDAVVHAARGDGAVFLSLQANTVLGTKARPMLKGTRDGILKKVQPVSIHGQVSWDVYFTDIEDPEGQPHVARVGPEAVMATNLEPGDRIQVEYLVGVAVRVTRTGVGGS